MRVGAFFGGRVAEGEKEKGGTLHEPPVLPPQERFLPPRPRAAAPPQTGEKRRPRPPRARRKASSPRAPPAGSDPFCGGKRPPRRVSKRVAPAAFARPAAPLFAPLLPRVAAPIGWGKRAPRPPVFAPASAPKRPRPPPRRLPPRRPNGCPFLPPKRARRAARARRKRGVKRRRPAPSAPAPKGSFFGRPPRPADAANPRHASVCGLFPEWG